MPKILSSLKRLMLHLNNGVEYNLESYTKTLEEINRVKLTNYTDAHLKDLSFKIRSLACRDGLSDELLVQSFALVREAAGRVLGMYPYDVQTVAGIALHKGKIVEMQTGEGKTLAAIMPAYFNAMTGQGVHVLTFNDYLARRDCEWMGPVYEFLGLDCGYVGEGMSVTERQQAYSAAITYVTAKEAGFDYLRDFLCTEVGQLVHRSFHYAIVDEADSILIDEARIPLVIAGNLEQDEKSCLDLSDIIRALKPGEDYEIDQYDNNVYFTDAGLTRIEEQLGSGNLHHCNNLDLLARLNCALHAEVLLSRDKDYVVRNGKVEIIDEFTGRIADKRHWPDTLHTAVEAKEGLAAKDKGTIMGSIALQHLLSLYPRFAGMTGTAITAAREFREFYGKEVVVVPTNRPRICQDMPDLIFTDRQAKTKALIGEIRRVYAKGQPILIGTASVAESEELAAALRRTGIACQVLNAKNDEMEAKIIADAGSLGAVTVSTNMAGRGVDIKLGGPEEQERAKVVELGGLYVIGTGLHESRRIDNQLRGRAGRQGDPGKTRFFISLEDELIKKYDVKQLIPQGRLPKQQTAPIDDPVVAKAITRGQRIIEGYNSDLRGQLWKYSFLIEQQRRIIHRKRQDILLDKVPLQLLSSKASERYASLRKEVGLEVLHKVEKQLGLYCINKGWADYLNQISYVREGIHLVVIGKKNPLDEFHRIAIDAFDQMLDSIDKEIVAGFEEVTINEEGINLAREGLVGPSTTWTYLINESPEQFSRLPFLMKAFTQVLQRSFKK